MQTTLGQFNETQSQDAFALQNSKLLKVALRPVTVQAKLGSMVAYQGDVTFEHRRLGRYRPDAQEGGDRRGHAADEDHRPRARCSWPTTAQDIHLIYLENDTITVNGREPARVRRRHRLGHPPRRGRGSVMGGGLYNMALQGTGWVAILSDGPPVLLNVAARADVRRRRRPRSRGPRA